MNQTLAPEIQSAPSVPLRALTLSLAALTTAVGVAVLSPQALLEQEILAWVLALVPALLLAHYRTWPAVTITLAVAMVVLCLAQVATMVFGVSFTGSPLILFVVAPYIAIALGAGWFSEVRRYASEQARADEALRRLEKALETMQLGVTITDLDGRIVYANPAEARMHGFTVDELINRDVGVYARPGARKPLTQEQVSELRSRSRETTNTRRDGSVFPVHLRSDVVQSATGDVVGVVTTCEDITERKRADDLLRGSLKQLREAQLQLFQAEKLESIGRMAAGVAHEVKNPLMTILTGVKILSKRLAGADEPVRVLLGDMTDAVGRADTIIGGLLNFSRERALDAKPTDLNDIVERSLLLVKHELDKAQIHVTRQLDQSLPALALDEFKIEQVLVNVLTNAIHAIGEVGEITVRSSAKTLALGANVGYRQTDRYIPGERVVMVQVDDTGPGIPEQLEGKIFDPFFTTKPTGVGTGLGLSVCRQIVEMHGGTVELANREPHGVRATIMLKTDRTEADDGETPGSARR